MNREIRLVLGLLGLLAFAAWYLALVRAYWRALAKFSSLVHVGSLHIRSQGDGGPASH